MVTGYLCLTCNYIRTLPYSFARWSMPELALGGADGKNAEPQLTISDQFPG